MDLKDVNQKLNQFIRPATYPVAVSMVASRSELPPSFAKAAEKPSPMLVCQGVTLARRYGWKVCLTPQDMVCPLGALALGFAPPTDDFMSGHTGVPNWVCDDAARSMVAEAIPKLPHGQGSYFIAEPLAQADWEPQMVIAYGNPAQMVRLVQSLVHHIGRPLNFSALGGIGCASYISQALITGQCQLVPCGAGDRIFAMAQDDEMAFAIPMGEMDKVLSGLEFTDKAGLRYPVTPYLRFHTDMPPSYQALMKNLAAGE